jgi:hypothetical protein
MSSLLRATRPAPGRPKAAAQPARRVVTVLRRWVL